MSGVSNKTTARWLWVLWFAFLLLSAYVVPYVFLTNYPKVSGAFLFWTLFSIISSISVVKVTLYWRD